MANPIASIVIAAVDKTKAVFSSVKGGLSSIGAAASAVRSQLGLIFAGLSLAGFIGQIKSTVDAMDAASKSAQKIGTSVENFSALSYAAGQSDVPVEELEKSLLKLSRTADDAISGLSTAVDVFARLKIDPKQFKDPADLLLVIADRFAAMPDGINKAALAQQLFGKSGAQLIPLLNAGRDGIKELTDEAAKLGVVFTTEAGAAAEHFNDNLDKLKSSGKGLGITLATDILPGLVQVTNAMEDAAKQGGLSAAVLAGLKFLNPFNDYLKNDSLDPIYRLSEAEKELNSLRAKGFEEDHKRVQQLKEYIPLIKVLADAERQAADAKKAGNEASRAATENKKLEVEAFKKATNEQITDAERLQSALQTAFETSTKAEEDYLRQAKKLRDEANGTTPVSGDVQSQASANLEAIVKAMELQREAGTASLQSVQDQSAALQQLAGQLDDQALKNDLIKQAKLAEAAALEKAAAEEKARYQGLTEQQNESLRLTQNMKAALDGIGKEVSVDLKAGPQTKSLIADLKEIESLIGRINTAQIELGSGASGRAASMKEALRTDALKFGRRQ